MDPNMIRSEGDLIIRFNPDKTHQVADEIVELIVSKKMSYAEARETLDIANEEIKHLELVK